MVLIFISHSKRDRNLILNVQTILLNLGHTPIIEEFIPEEEKQPIPHEEIRNNVRISYSMFLFLTDNILATEYTRSWVAFEVGLAKDQDKRVFVFERQGVPIPYPIPYVTDYMLFDPDSISDLLGIQGVARKMTPRIPPGAVGAGLGGLVGSMFGPLGAVLGALGLGWFAQAAAQPEATMMIKCPYPNCGVDFRYHSPNIPSFQCPTCRQGIVLTNGR